MDITWNEYKIGETQIRAKVTNYKDGDKQKLKELYLEWLNLNNEIKKISTRGINLPDAISENSFCLFFDNCVRVVKLGRGKCSYDVLNTSNGSRIQIKASSIDEDLTSFGPRSEWDELYFLDFSRSDCTFDVYKIDPEYIYNHRMNSNQTFSDQQRENRRPRFSIKREIIRKLNLKPVKTCSLC